MKSVYLTAGLAALLTACSIGALALTGRAISVSPGTPARAHRTLGAVAVVSETRPAGVPWSELHAPLLAAEARARYGSVDAVAGVRHAVLPNGTGAVTTGLAIGWD